MITDTRQSEYRISTFSPIDYEKHDKWSIDGFLAQGGKIRNLSNNIHADPDYGLFDKRIEELAAIARINRRKHFTFSCEKHGVTKHRTKDMCCVKCVDEKLHDAKLKEIVNKHCGVTRG